MWECGPLGTFWGYAQAASVGGAALALKSFLDQNGETDVLRPEHMAVSCA